MIFFFFWCFTYHQVKTANPSGAVTVMIRVRQSFTRKAIPASSMLPADQARLPITPINDRWPVSTHSMHARWGTQLVKSQTCNNWVLFGRSCEHMTHGVEMGMNSLAYWGLLSWCWCPSVRTRWEISALQTGRSRVCEGAGESKHDGHDVRGQKSVFPPVPGNKNGEYI